MSQSIEVKQINSYDDEIDLLELFKTIWNKKLLIISITALFTVLAGSYAFYKTPIFEVKTIFEMGSIIKQEKRTNLENVNALINKTNIIYNLNVPIEELTRIKGAKLLAGTERLIELKVESTSNEKALALLNEIITAINLSHKQTIDNYLTLVNNQLILLEGESIKLHKKDSSLVADISIKEKIIESLLIDNAAVAAIYSINLNSQNTELTAIRERIYDLERDMSEIKLALLPVNIKLTAVLGDVIINELPIAPNKKLIVILGFMLGFILSIMFVLIMSFVKKHKESE